VLRGDHRAHPLLRFAHQDLFGAERRVAQQDPVQPHVHAPVTVAGELAGRTRDAGTAQVLDPLDQPRAEHLQRALDQ